ncbi:RNA-binding domain-containing protein [Mammaliicoccus sp. A-M2]|uniref:RNA-binding domain-containing protein n=1 Tax=Mammaliicoccus sp. A-M2 TaxID=2898662 RepID=UPI001EFAD99D|nr:RNA-binding domain-containing protein [Mammaliicoccus sp. A-M2]
MSNYVEENLRIEYKKAENDLPKSFWDTYSSFSNTKGGYVILGIEETRKGTKVTGVKNEQKIIKDLVTLANDKSYTSYNNIHDENIRIIKEGEHKVIQIYIPEVSKANKPVYIKGNINNSFIRRNDSDQRMTDIEIRRHLRDANPENDSMLLNNYDISDLDAYAVKNYKNIVQQRETEIDILSMDDWEFLKRYGAVKKDREDGKYKLVKGALLFFGKENSIVDCFPFFHLDYRNRVGETIKKRWIDRVSSGEINSTEINVFNFYNIVLEKMVNTVMESFELNVETQRRENVEEGVKLSIREALANSLIHADYEENTTIKIEAFKSYYEFNNPGEMLITPEEFAMGSESKTRNATLFTLFRNAGYSEKAGSGGVRIFQIAKKNKFRMPEIESKDGKTSVKIWKTDLVSSYDGLNDRETQVLNYIEKKRAVTKKEIQGLEGMTEYYAKLTLGSLIDKKVIYKIGEGKSTKYGFLQSSSEMVASIEHDMRHIQNMIINAVKDK